MSFSSNVKEELSKLSNLANKKEVRFEAIGYYTSNNMIEEDVLKYSTENQYNIDRFSKLIRNIGIENFDISVNGKAFYVEIKKKHKEKFEFDIKELEEESNFRAFTRGIFMGSGSINNPENSYHLECRIKE